VLLMSTVDWSSPGVTLLLPQPRLDPAHLRLGDSGRAVVGLPDVYQDFYRAGGHASVLDSTSQHG
jgi:hypothetical protein